MVKTSRCLAAGILMLVTVNAHAEQISEGVNREIIDRLCNVVAMNAESIMMGRQRGASLTEIMQFFDDTPEGEFRGINMRETIRELALSAYERPRFNTPAMQNAEVMDFRNEAHVMCLRGFQN